jgi:hypothetical protein
MKFKPKTQAQQLADYIKTNLKKGYTIDSLRFSLETQGYSKISVENAVGLANKQIAEQIPAVKETPQITYRVISKDLDSGESNEEVIKITHQKSFWKKLFG